MMHNIHDILFDKRITEREYFSSFEIHINQFINIFLTFIIIWDYFNISFTKELSLKILYFEYIRNLIYSKKYLIK